MEMRVVMPKGASTGEPANRPTAAFGDERVSQWPDSREVDRCDSGSTRTGREMGSPGGELAPRGFSDNSNEGVKMSRSVKKRGALFGAALGVGATLALVIGLGVFAGAGGAASAAPPQNTSLPTITGIPQQGHSLVGHRGTWSGNPTDYNDFWMRCAKDGASCANISGANDKNGYLLKSIDVGNTIRFKVEAKNADGSTFARSTPTAVIAAAIASPPPPPPPATGCPSGSGTVQVADLKLPALLLIDSQQSSPSVVHRGAQQIILRYHVSACGGRSVQGALVYGTAVPFAQLSIPGEQATGPDGFAELDFRTLAGFPASPHQQLLAIFVRARKSGEDLLGGISTRRLFSVPVSLNG
jgi:hypothetical protein